MRKDLRQGKVLIDWSQNDEHKTTVCVYSLRAKERPTVSTPVTWDEVEDALAAGDAGRLTFDSADVLDRVERHGDLFGPVVELEQELPSSRPRASRRRTRPRPTGRSPAGRPGASCETRAAPSRASTTISRSSLRARESALTTRASPVESIIDSPLRSRARAVGLRSSMLRSSRSTLRAVSKTSSPLSDRTAAPLRCVVV